MPVELSDTARIAEIAKAALEASQGINDPVKAINLAQKAAKNLPPQKKTPPSQA